MNTSRIPSPARSLGVISTPRKHTPRRSRSVCSAKSNVSVRLTKVISDSFQISPISNRRSVLNDDTDIEIPGRKSWWKKLGENSRDMMDLLDNKDIAEVNNVAEEFDVEILSQEKKNYSLDLPESSDGESINSIVIPQRKLFTQKENQVQKKFEHIIDNRETLAKLQKSHFDQEKDIDVGPKNLFNKASKPRTKPAFPAALLNVSSKAVNKTKEMPAPEVEGQVRNLFGNRPGMKRKNLFADFIVSESEDEIPDIQPKVFGFQKNAQKRCENSASRGVGHSPTSSIDLELDDWKLLPSSTMVENQFEEATTPIKRAKLSKLSEAKESETMNTNSTVNKTRQSNKSATSKNKSKTSMSKLKDKKDEELLSASKTKEDLLKSKNNLSLNTSSNVRMTRNKSKSIESPLKVEEHTKLHNKSKNKSQSHLITPMEVQEGDKNTENNEIIMKTGLNQQDFEKQNKNVAAADAPEEDDEDFTLEYDNDDEQVNEPLAADNIENKSNENINLIDEERNKTQNKDKLDDVHVEKQKDDNKQQYFNTSLIKNFDKQNKSADKVKEINRSQSKGKQKQSLSDSQKNNSRKSKNVTLDEVHQKTKNESRIEKDKMDTEEKNVTNDIENTDEGENINESTQHNESTQRNDSSKTNDEIDSQNETDETDEENEQQNESQQLGNENEEQRESTDSNDDNEIRNKSKESEAEIKERNESTQLDHEREQQNESSQSNNDIQNESIQSDVENEIEQENNHEDVDETIIEAEEEETENEQDESEDEQKTEEQVQQDESEAEQETEEHIPQNESENNNSKNQEQSDSKSNHSETEEQENEAMEIEHEEEYESDLEEQNETENQESETENQESETENQESETENQESENYDSDDNLQNESNLSKNDEQEEQVESDQVQNEDVREENEVIETFNHDATLRNKKKDPTIVKSPEVILHDKTNQMESFTTEGRNTSIRKTKSIIKNLNKKPSLAPVRESTGFSDGTRDSSAEGSGWDSHRTTRKTIRLTLGKDFTPRKSLRALVMEKSAKRHTNINEVTTKVPQANSTELPAFDSYEDAAEMNEMVEEPSDHEISARTRQTTLENYLQKIKQENLEKKRKMEEEIRASLKAPTRDIFNPFKVPLKPVRRIKPVQNKPRPKQTKPSAIPLNMLPPEVLEDMKYKPPKRFQPSNASWITKRLYKFLENKLEPKYDYKARIRAERLVELLYGFTREIKRGPSDQAIDTLKKEMARLEIVKTHFDFYEFFHEFMPREIRVKVVPDIVNKISLPRGGVFSEILQ